MKVYITYDFSYLGSWTLSPATKIFSTKRDAELYINEYYKENGIILNVNEFEVQ